MSRLELSAVICPPDVPLLGFLSLVMPVIAAGNTAIVVPSESYPLITGDLYQLFDTSDLPGGAVNIVTGYSSQLLKTLAEHDDVDAIWCFGDEASAVRGKIVLRRKSEAGVHQRRPRHRLARRQSKAKAAGFCSTPRRSRISGFPTASDQQMRAVRKPRVKICCIKSVEEAELAIAFGASALGLVSQMPSGPGVIEESRIAEIAALDPSSNWHLSTHLQAGR